MTGREPREVRITVCVTPRGGRDSVDGVRDGQLLVRVAAPAAEGAANEAALRLVAAAAGVPRRAARLVVGATGRRKVIALEGANRAALNARWPGLGV